MVALVGDGVPALAQQRPRTVAYGFDLERGKQLTQALAERTIEIFEHALDDGEDGVRHEVARKVPDDRAQLVLDVERQAVIDAVDVAVRPSARRQCPPLRSALFTSTSNAANRWKLSGWDSSNVK